MSKENEEELIDQEELEEEDSEESGESAEAAIEESVQKATSGIKLFNRWSFDDIAISDDSLRNYINLNPVIIPHSGGKHQKKGFWKTEHISIVERFINRLLSPGLLGKRIKGRGASLTMGKKQKILKIMFNVFSIIENKTKENPIQVLVSAIENAAPREDTTRISLGGISYQQAVDIAPQRRVDQAIRIIVQGTVGQTYNNIRTIDEILAAEIILCSQNDAKSRAIKRKDELERMAIAAR
jgi:small subunit ribosomal protein S7